MSTPEKPSTSQPQGTFFQEEVHRVGGTEPTLQKEEVTYKAVQGGTYPEERTPELAPQIPTDDALSEQIALANASDKSRRAQIGKHSPLERDGTYLAVKAGDVLPGFGVVTYGNIQEAMSHAETLERNRNRRNQ